MRAGYIIETGVSLWIDKKMINLPLTIVPIFGPEPALPHLRYFPFDFWGALETWEKT